MKFITSFILLCLMASSVAMAHQDTWIKHENDTLIGLPEKYQPATFSYQTKELRIGTNSVVIPNDVWELFGDTTLKENEIIFSASWYPTEGLPPYMLVRNRNIEFLVNLDTLSIIDFLKDKNFTLSHMAEWESAKTNIPNQPARKTPVESGND